MDPVLSPSEAYKIDTSLEWPHHQHSKLRMKVTDSTGLYTDHGFLCSISWLLYYEREEGIAVAGALILKK